MSQALAAGRIAADVQALLAGSRQPRVDAAVDRTVSQGAV